MDKIDTILCDGANKRKYHQSIQIAAELARRTLNRYYQKTDLTDVSRVAMSESINVSTLVYSKLMYQLPLRLVLHPKYKTVYFQKHGWPDTWIDEAVTLAREIYLESYAEVRVLKVSRPGPDNRVPSPNLKVCE